jgi:hypothetical protein
MRAVIALTCGAAMRMHGAAPKLTPSRCVARAMRSRLGARAGPGRRHPPPRGARAMLSSWLDWILRTFFSPTGGGDRNTARPAVGSSLPENLVLIRRFFAGGAYKVVRMRRRWPDRRSSTHPTLSRSSRHLCCDFAAARTARPQQIRTAIAAISKTAGRGVVHPAECSGLWSQYAFGAAAIEIAVVRGSAAAGCPACRHLPR